MDAGSEVGKRVDINSASVEDFVTRLKGVGHSKAKAIVRFRTTVGKFKKLCELTDVPGITTQILEKNQNVLLCVSGRNRHLPHVSARDEDVDGITPETSIIFSGESGGEDNVDWNGEQSHVRWRRNLNHTFFTDERPSQNKDSVEVETLDTPSTSAHNLEDSLSSPNSNTPIMRSNRTRSRSKNEERTFSMSTRSTPSSKDPRPQISQSEDGDRSALVLNVSPTRSGRLRKIVADKPLSRRRNERLKSTGSPDGPIQLATPDETNTDLYCEMDTDRCGPARKCTAKQLMKRKLGRNIDLGKPHTPQKKSCKAIHSSVIPVSGESSVGWAVTDPLSPQKSVIRNPVTLVKIEGLPEWLNRFQKWNSTERLSALDKLIDACEPIQARHMLEVIEPQFQRDFISLLPKELALYVLSFLEPKDLVVAAQTCRYWHVLTEDNILWREKCAEEGIQEPYYPKVCRTSLRPKKGVAVHPSVWKASFLHQHQIEMNWRNGNHKPSKLLKGHDDHVITCLQFSGTRIVSGSDDNTLKVWSAISGKCLRTLVGHTGGVWASQMRKNMIISGSTDRTLKIWNADSGACVHTLYGHTSTVRCMALHDNIVVSGSRDATLRVWDVDAGDCLHVLSGHLAAVRCVCYDGRRVVSGAYDYNVKVWDPVREVCLHTLDGHTNRVYSLQFDGTHVVSGSLDTLIKVWSVETGQCLHTLVGHQSLTSGMELKNNILVSGNADSTVKMWDIISGNCLKTLEGPQKHLSAVTCLQFLGKFVITSSDDGTVKLWDVRTGKVIRNLVSLDSRGSGGVVWRIRATPTKLVCAVGSRNGTEETKLLVLDFDPDSK